MPKNDRLPWLAEQLASRGVDAKQVTTAIAGMNYEVPSWGFANAGTRFGPVIHPGAAVTIEEKIADAAQVNLFTGAAPSVAVHVKWDFPNGLSDCSGVGEVAEQHGIRIGAINPNVFQDQDYVRDGSITNERPEIRRRAISHMLESIEIGKVFGSDVLSLWFADGSDYPGAGNFFRRIGYAEESLQQVYAHMPPGMKMLLEYKLFEPAFYATDIFDWGAAYSFVQNVGPSAYVLVDLGHHFPGQNIEQIVAMLLYRGRLGGFHFNDHKFADDDLTAGSIDPHQLFRIFQVIVQGLGRDANINPALAYMIDQADPRKPRVAAMIQTIMSLQTYHAKALTINRTELCKAQRNGDPIGAEACMREAFETDVAPLLEAVREGKGLAPNPLKAFLESGYTETMAAERGVRQGAGLGA